MTIGVTSRITSNLKHLRKYFGYTQDQIADKLHLTRTSYCQYELGNKMLPIDIIFALASVYNISPSTILEQNESIFLHNLSYRKSLNENSLRLIEIYNQLNPFNQGRLIERAEELLETNINQNK